MQESSYIMIAYEKRRNNRAMKRIIITGATGLIGSHLLHTLSSQALTLYPVCRSQQPSRPLPGQPCYLDLSDNWDISLLPKQVDTIIYLAQSEHFREFPDKAESIFRINTLSVLRFLDYARTAGCKMFIFASSGGIYGNSPDALKEDMHPPLNQLGFYLSTKLSSEIILENYLPFFTVIILRFFFVYGPGQRQHMLIPRLIQNVRSGQPITLQGEEGLRINPTYVDDAVQAIVSALSLSASQKINVGGPEILSLREIGQIIGSKLQTMPRFTHVEGPPQSLVGDIGKMSELLGPPRIRFADGLDRLLSSSTEERAKKD